MGRLAVAAVLLVAISPINEGGAQLVGEENVHIDVGKIISQHLSCAMPHPSVLLLLPVFQSVHAPINHELVVA